MLTFLIKRAYSVKALVYLSADIYVIKSMSRVILSFINGLVESLKMFLTNDSKSFKFMHENIENAFFADQSLLKDTILGSVKIKSAVNVVPKAVPIVDAISALVITGYFLRFLSTAHIRS